MVCPKIRFLIFVHKKELGLHQIFSASASSYRSKGQIRSRLETILEGVQYLRQVCNRRPALPRSHVLVRD